MIDDFADFLKRPDRVEPKLHIVELPIVDMPVRYRRKLGPRSWSTLDVFFACALTAFIVATLALLVVPR